MNITTPQQCIEQWEKDFLKTGNDSLIPKEDRERVLHEIDVLYSEMYELLLSVGITPDVKSFIK